MKKRYLLLLLVLIPVIFPDCKNSQEKEKLKSTRLITAKSLGLGYLEEFKLDDAEKEFLEFIRLAPGEKLGYANLGLTYLRMGKYEDAEKQLLKAIKIDPQDPDIRLILATVYQMNDQRDRAIKELKDALDFAPGHVKILYDLSELYSTSEDPGSRTEYKNSLLQLVGKAPGNLVPKLSLTAVYINEGETDKAIELLEQIKKEFPEFPKEASDYFDKTMSSLRKGDNNDANLQFTIFHNYMKVTPPYQAGIMDLKGPGGSLIGFPLITFDQQSFLEKTEERSLLDIMKFTDASLSAGLDIIPRPGEEGNIDAKKLSHVETADYDGDGDIDLYVGSYDTKTSTYRHYLFNNEMGRFTDVTENAGLKHSGWESSASFADFDNDGFLDLCIIYEHGILLYRNTGKGTFENVTGKSKINSSPGGNMGLFFDLDHDGDLDLFEARSGPNMLFRNNSDGTFLEQASKMGIEDGSFNTKDAAFGDFDEDGDIDFIVVNEDANCILYSNLRQGLFRDVTADCGLETGQGSCSVSAGDYDNDGFLDLFIPSDNGTGHKLFRNKNDGTFEPAVNDEKMFSEIRNTKVQDALFFDFDNDGFLDLLVAGIPAEKGGNGVFLYHNDGKGGFDNTSRLLPADLKEGRQIARFDYNDDGDIDLLIAGVNGGVTLLRNDGGNTNHYVKMKLVGLRAGSAKNNHFGIGAKVEIRAGELYESMVVDDPDVFFGIGNRSMADIIRITWTNGVPQNIFFPQTDQSLIEAQTLKGSCPFLYAWDGTRFEFVKDVLWRSALGMPLGIMGGTTAFAFPDASDDFVKITGDQLKSENGLYNIRVTSELWETIYLDKVLAVAVDHPDSTDIFVAEQFSGPPFPGLQIFKVRDKQIPVRATDSEGNDVLPLISEKDDKYLHGVTPGKYQGITEMKELILDPGNLGQSDQLYLFLTGWIFPTDASINVAISQSDMLKVVSPQVQVLNKNGKWETVIENLGFPMGKDKTIIADLSGKFLSSDHRVKIRTNMDIYWDYIFFSGKLSSDSLILNDLSPVSADLHYRGFSELYRKGGRYGPHWFDYYKVSKEPQWRDLQGNYTRYGDVLPLLSDADNKYIISNAGDETSISFSAATLPELKTGWKRDFLINFVGWVKDGDINTAFGQSVTPLPFHGMKSYPPGPSDNYPENPELKEYNMKYNTRTVTRDNYLNAVKGNTELLDKR
jgi:tetratricopeptide (TPR) repeat protein